MEKGFWKKSFTDAGLYFSAASLVIFIIKIIMSKNSIYEQAFSVTRMLLLLGFCLVLSLSNKVLGVEKLNGFIKLLIHASGCLIGFFLLVYAPLVADGKYQAGLVSKTYDGANIFVVIGIVVVLYAICYGTYSIISTKRRKKKNIKSEYKSVYKNKN